MRREKIFPILKEPLFILSTTTVSQKFVKMLEDVSLLGCYAVLLGK